MLSVSDIQKQAESLLDGVDEGAPLDALSRELIALAVTVSVTSVDPDAIRDAITGSYRAGATMEQIQEIVSLVSGLGVHSLMMSSATILGGAAAEQPLDDAGSLLWEKYVGDDPYWKGFEAEFPGFLLSLLKLSPAAFEAFFIYCAVPWSTRNARAVVKELSAMACDATPTHRFGPGFRLHLKNAIQLGAGASAIREALAIARSAPVHPGVA